jgi:hypothetical protein
VEQRSYPPGRPPGDGREYSSWSCWGRDDDDEEEEEEEPLLALMIGMQLVPWSLISMSKLLELV